MIEIVLLIHLSGTMDVVKIPVDVCPVIPGVELFDAMAHSSLYQEGDKVRSHCETKRADG